MSTVLVALSGLLCALTNAKLCTVGASVSKLIESGSVLEPSLPALSVQASMLQLTVPPLFEGGVKMALYCKPEVLGTTAQADNWPAEGLSTGKWGTASLNVMVTSAVWFLPSCVLLSDHETVGGVLSILNCSDCTLVLPATSLATTCTVYSPSAKVVSSLA